MSTKLEINFNRLLNRCEKVAADKTSWDWRLEKYVEALHTQLAEIKRSTSKPVEEVITEYSRRVEFLKGLLEAEKMPTVTERALAAERLAPVSHTHTATSMAPKEVHQHAKSRLQKDMRDELLSDSRKDVTANGLRQRKPQEEEDIDLILQHHRQMHEKLAEELLHHTINLKDFAYNSSAIVKKDIEGTRIGRRSLMSSKLEQIGLKLCLLWQQITPTKVTDTNKLADSNYSNLQTQSQRLEAKTKSCNWWIWIMLMLVTLTFLWMVVLMRMFPKS